MENNVNRKVPHDICVGCGACTAKCNKQSITMQEGTMGFLYPTVDISTCVDCGLCVKVCPVVNKPICTEPLNVYAAIAKDIKTLTSSNSGGFFTVAALHVLQHGGYVCGAVMDDNLEVVHIVTNKVEDLAKMQGSKYVQSKTGLIYIPIKERLKEGKTILFSGTGCQVAGLRTFLGKEYDNLITIEVVCHGVPSPGLYRRYIDWLSKKNGSKVESYKFRSKHKRPTGEHSEFFYSVNGKQLIGRSLEDPYYGSFLQGVTLRESCYDCLFKGKSRVADFTIGDFWGIEKFHKGFPIGHGTSMVMVNTEKGQMLFESFKDALLYEYSSYEAASSVNHSMEMTASKGSQVIDLESQSLFDIDLVPKLSFKDKIKNRLPWQVKLMIKKWL
jgi:coenzyme F420-reducing hydrogenase beta subunit